MPRSVAELLPSIPLAGASQDGLISSTSFRIVGEQSGAATFDPTAVDLSVTRSYSDVTQSGAMAFALDGAVTPVGHVLLSVLVTGNGSAITYSGDFAAVDGSDLTGAPYSGFVGTKRLMLSHDPATGKALVAWSDSTSGGNVPWLRLAGGIIQDYASPLTHGASGAVAPDLQSGLVGAIRVTMDANGTSWAPTNVPTTTTARYPVTVRFIQGAGGSATLDLSALDWGAAGAPTLGATAGDWLEVMMVYDHGTLYPRYVDSRTA